MTKIFELFSKDYKFILSVLFVFIYPQGQRLNKYLETFSNLFICQISRLIEILRFVSFYRDNWMFHKLDLTVFPDQPERLLSSKSSHVSSD